MTQRGLEDVLFPEEIVPWDEVVRLVINLRIPFRHRAKGIECITGGISSFQTIPGGSVNWLPFVMKEDFWGFIKEHLQELPSLEFPVSLGIANDFVDKFIMLKDSPNYMPSFLTSMSLNVDQQQRNSQFKEEKEELQKLVLNRDVFLVDASRSKCEYLTHGVYFSKRQAIQYLDKKGLLERAFATGCSWRDQILEPDVGGLSSPNDDAYYGLPKELIKMGVEEYRKTLTLRKSEIVANQLAHFHHKQLEGQVIEENSSESNAPVSMIEPDESRPTLAADVPPVIQVSSLPTVGNNNIKSISSEHFVVSENDESMSMKKSPVTESETILDSEKDTAVKRLIGMKEVMERLGVSRPTIYNYLDPSSPSYNPDFPQPMKLNSENKWVESEINAFVEGLNRSKKKRGPKQDR